MLEKQPPLLTWQIVFSTYLSPQKLSYLIICPINKRYGGLSLLTQQWGNNLLSTWEALISSISVVEPLKCAKSVQIGKGNYLTIFLAWLLILLINLLPIVIPLFQLVIIRKIMEPTAGKILALTLLLPNFYVMIFRMTLVRL